ncbi:MAG: NAD(P)-binding domain-containing protein [Acidimicrobiales bacterium]
MTIRARERVGEIGTGLIGSSMAAGLRRRGVAVSGFDLDPARAERAHSVGHIDQVARQLDEFAGSRLCVVAVPRPW